MGCIEAVKRALVRLGVLPNFTDDEFKDAETENIVVDRERTMNELQEKYAMFNRKSDNVSAVVDRKKHDVQNLLEDIRNMSAAADARTLFENMIAERRSPLRRQ